MGMVSLDACIYTIIAVLGVAYPILLQVISRLDDKYSSVRAVALFEQEPARKWFEYFLISSVAAVIIWFLKIPAPTSSFATPGWLRLALANSALGLVFLTTIGLLVFFFLLTRKTITYYNAQKLTAYLQAQYQKNRKREQYFEVLSDIFLAAVAARNSPLTTGIATFLSDEFTEKRSQEEVAVIYPRAYYWLTYRTTEELAQLGNRKNKGLVHLATGGGWLLGGHRHHIISEDTYSALWNNIIIALEYGQEDMVYEYWRTAHQYIQFELATIAREYEENDFSLRATNQQAVTFREQERARFLEFHYVLGALLLYSGKRDLLRRLFDYTNSQPPRYLLLPAYMTDIFLRFVGIREPSAGLLPIDTRYSFPNEAGLAAEPLITKWIFTYLAVLFLRQYTLDTYLMWDKPLDYPDLPEGQPAKKSWLDAMGLFRNYITQVLQDRELLQKLRLDFITEAWCTEQGIDYPLDFLATVESRLRASYEVGAVELVLSREKINKFYVDSGRLLESAAESVLRLAMPDGGRAFQENRYLRGQQIVVDKDQFSSTPEVAHLHYSTFFATAVVFELKRNVAGLFARNSSATYRVREQEIFVALDKLAIGSDYLIINLGLNLSYLATEAQLEGWQPDSYQGSEILDFRVDALSDSLFIMRRSELPTISLLPPDPAAIEKYGLQEISQQFRLYASVLDANSISSDIAAEVLNGRFGKFNEKDLKSQALQIIWLLLEVKWEQGAKLVQLIASHDEEVSDNDLTTITSF